MILLETKRTSVALTGRIRVLAGDGLMLLLVLSCGRCLVTVCAYVYARDNGSHGWWWSACVLWLPGEDQSNRLRSVSGRRDLCDFLIKLRIDFYRGTPRSHFHGAMIRSHQPHIYVYVDNVPVRSGDDVCICCVLIHIPGKAQNEGDPDDCHWACLGWVTAHSQSTENEMTTTIATYKSIIL